MMLPGAISSKNVEYYAISRSVIKIALNVVITLSLAKKVL
jgi:hypothetical protein